MTVPDRECTRRDFVCGAAAALIAAPSAVAPTPTLVLEVKGMRWDELCTAEALQGLANRRGPRVFLDHGDAADQRWLGIYAERAGLTYERLGSLAELAARCRPAWHGVILYDPGIDGSRCAAITAAGVMRALPASHEVARALGDTGPVVLDLRGRFGRSVDAYAWALSQLMPRCSRRLAHSVDGGRVDGVLTGVCGPMSGFDWQVQNRGFVFNLGAQATKMVSYGGEVGGDADQAAMYARILAALTQPAQINGYGDPEDYWCLLLSRHGHYSFHAFHNWSFHSRVPVRRPLRQRVTFTPESVTPDPKRISVCFMTSEGDTMKGPLPFFYGSWFDPARGSVAVNWGVNPLMARLFPAMLDYFYATATPSDGFFAGPSGAGYCYPDVMPDAPRFARHTAAEARRAGIECIDLWGGAIPSVQDRFARAGRPIGITTFTSPARWRLGPGGVPVVNHELGYWQAQGVEGAHWSTVFEEPAARARSLRGLVTRIERIAGRVTPPFVVLVLGDLHSYDRHARLYADVAAALDPARFRVVRLDQAFCELRRWASERVVVGGESLCERPAWAVLGDARTRLPITLTNGRAEPTSVRAVCEGGRAVRAALRAHERRDVVLRTVEPGWAGTGPLAVTIEAAGKAERLAVDTVTVPGGTGLTEVTLARVWGSDYLVHPSGAPAADPQALRGTAWRSPAPGGKSECIACGPYSDLPAGRYLVAFRLRLDQSATGLDVSTKLAAVDVAAGGYGAKGGVRASADVTAGDIDPAGAWTWRLLECDWAGSPDLMETRVYTHGRAAVLVDRIAVFGCRAGGE